MPPSPIDPGVKSPSDNDGKGEREAIEVHYEEVEIYYNFIYVPLVNQFDASLFAHLRPIKAVMAPIDGACVFT